MSKGTYVTAAVATAGVLGGAYLAYHLYKKTQKIKIPTEWKEVGILKDIYVYPIKSCGPVIKDKAEVAILGLKDGWLRDRILMIVDEKNNFITARVYPELLLVHPTVRNSVLTLNHNNMETIHVNLAEVAALQSPKTAVVWGVEVPVYDCGAEASQWFSSLLNRAGITFRLVYYASMQSRPIKADATTKVYKFTKNDSGALPDEVPFNLINEASVDDLNTRLKGLKVSPRNFRPNFVLKGAQAYEEDNWKFVKIGEHVFEIIKPCFRCILTTIDPETGVRNQKTEPLETLKSYRQMQDPEARRAAGTSPRLGLHMSLRTTPGGIISLNDRIYIA